MAIFGHESVVHAQTSTAAASSDQGLEEVVVTGIRYSLEKSLEEKRTANSVIDVITAEDIGKMPDKNIADSLQRVPGITISSAGASEGGFDENDRVSMRGTNPSLTQTLINGHNIAAGDWFVLNQTGTVGRSVSYTLLPSELVSSIVVHKSSEADLVEGGVAGSIDIITRRALDIPKPFTFEANVGAVYADQPRKGDPQASALVNWHNDASNFGVLVQGYYEQRHLQREGVELLGYDTIAATSAMALAHPDLSGVQYPTDIGAALFTQKRTRKGGLADVQWIPSDSLGFDLSAFLSNLDAPNYNRNFLLWNTHYINSGAGQAPDPGYVVTNGTLTKATFTGVPGTFYGVYDQIARPNESESSNYINLDTNFKLTSSLSFLLQLGISKGSGKTPTQDVSETQPDQGGGASYQLNGIGNGPNFAFLNTNVTTPNGSADNPNGPVPFGWIFGAQNVAVYDKEDWGKLDGLYNVGNGAWSDLKFGLRLESHDRSSLGAIAQGPTGGSNPDTYPVGFSNYPTNFENFGGNIPVGMWYWTPAQLAAYNSPANVNRDPITRAYIPNGWYKIAEKTQAAYVQGDFKGEGWAGNIGVRVVRTHEDVDVYAQDSSVTATTPGAVLTSAFGPYVARPVEHSYTDVLPTANLKLDLSPTLIARFAAGKTMTRADYSAIGGNTSLNAPPVGTTPGSGSSGNPDLKPVVSLNLDAGLEWYFTRRSLLSATAFYMDLENYIGYGTKPLTEFSFSQDFPAGQDLNYLITTPLNAKGRVYGAEFAYQQALSEHFGVAANYTYADGKQTSNVQGTQVGNTVIYDDRLVGTSKSTYNVNGYFENSMFSARLAYNYRSSFYSGLDRSTAFSQAAIGYLSASLGWTITKNFSLTLDGQNLNNPTLKYYALNQSQPRAFYVNGRQYYLNLRAKF
ncbi:MAG TPA: TonB-dependent receptor [Steroidobacteraceae bacterium]|jgi:iron complex outermembrane receptor protein